MLRYIYPPALHHYFPVDLRDDEMFLYFKVGATKQAQDPISQLD